jgi:hypothetical protein
MLDDTREKAYRFVAYSAVTFSLVAILAVFITLPMVNNYVNHVHAKVHHEMEFCKVFTKHIVSFSFITENIYNCK